MTDAADDLRITLHDIITTAARNTPRSLQKQIGPSEVGLECPRRLAYRWLDWPTANPGGDPWPAIVGTATHTWLADALEQHNQVLGRTRWLVEQRVTIRGDLNGSCDAYDLDTDTVLDHKVVGETAMRHYRRAVRHQYRVQAHLYGLGWENAGYTPRRVALVFYPRGGLLSGLYVWAEPYNRQIAQDALDRLDAIRELANRLRVDEDPDAWQHIPANPGPDCRWCPWMRPGSRDLSQGCPGMSTTTTRTHGFEDLINRPHKPR